MFQGSMVALVTPMHDDGAIDEEGLERLVEFHVEHGTDAIVSVGTTGESATVDEAEHCNIIRRTVEMADGRLPVIAGTGANSTAEAIRLTQCAKVAGAQACLLVTPYYNKPTQEGLYQHHMAIARAVDIPQILYNVPGRTAVDMLPETVEQLSRAENIIGIKEATGDLDRVEDILERCGDTFILLSGDDATSLDFILKGGHGTISVTANVAPAMMRNMCALAIAGEARQAREINSRLESLHRDLFVESNPIPVKWALHEMGLIGSGTRLPMTILAERFRTLIRDDLAAAGITVNQGEVV